MPERMPAKLAKAQAPDEDGIVREEPDEDNEPRRRIDEWDDPDWELPECPECQGERFWGGDPELPCPTCSGTGIAP